VVPRLKSKVVLQENGHIISAFEFRKEWNEIDVELEKRLCQHNFVKANIGSLPILKWCSNQSCF